MENTEQMPTLKEISDHWNFKYETAKYARKVISKMSRTDIKRYTQGVLDYLSGKKKKKQSADKVTDAEWLMFMTSRLMFLGKRAYELAQQKYYNDHLRG